MLLQRYLLLVFFAFPALTLCVPHGAGISLLPLAIVGLFFVKPGWQEFSIDERRLMYGLIAVLITVLLSFINSINIANSVVKLERYIIYPLAILALMPLIRTRLPLFKIFSWGIVAGAIIGGLVALVQVFMLKHKVATGAYYAISFGNLATLVVGLNIVLFLTVRDSKIRLFALIGICMALVASVLADSRGAWLLFPVIALLVLWDRWGRFRPKQKLSMVAAMVFGLIALWQVPAINNGIGEGIQSLNRYVENPLMDTREKLTSWGERLNLWRDATILWQQSPILGHGLGDFKTERHKMIERGESYLYTEYDHSHSVYFDALANTGLLGLVTLLLGLFILPLLYFYRAYRQSTSTELHFFALAGIMVVLAFAVFGISEAWTSRNPIARPYVLYLLSCIWGVMYYRRYHGVTAED